MPSREETMLWIRTIPFSVMTERSRDPYLGGQLLLLYNPSTHILKHDRETYCL